MDHSHPFPSPFPSHHPNHPAPAAQSHAALLRAPDPPRRVLRELRQRGADGGAALRGALHLAVRTPAEGAKDGRFSWEKPGENGERPWKKVDFWGMKKMENGKLAVF